MAPALGAYSAHGVLASGGTSTVYAASHPGHPVRVALKVLHAPLVGDAELVMRFLNEAHCLQRVQHPGLPRLWDCGFLPGGQPFLALELLTQTLDERRAQAGGRLTAAAVAWLGASIGGALSALHESGAVHRDVKPANVMFSDTGATKLIDLGLAKLAAPVSLSPGPVSAPPHLPVSTADRALLGTLEYMAPEQWIDSKHVDGAADVYALGAVLYQALSGGLPFQAARPPLLMDLHLFEPPPPLPADTPPPLAALILAALGKRRDERPTAAALAAACAALA